MRPFVSKPISLPPLAGYNRADWSSTAWNTPSTH